MMIGADYVVTQPFFTPNGTSGGIDFLPDDHLFLLGQGYDPGWFRALLSRGATRKMILFFVRSDMGKFVRVGRQV